MPAREVIRVDADGVPYFEHPLGALLDYTVDLMNDPGGPALGGATLTSNIGVRVTGEVTIGNAAATYTPPASPSGLGSPITPPAPSANTGSGTMTFWAWTATAAAVGDVVLLEAWYRSTGPERVSTAKLRLRIT